MQPRIVPPGLTYEEHCDLERKRGKDAALDVLETTQNAERGTPETFFEYLIRNADRMMPRNPPYWTAYKEEILGRRK